MDKETVIQAISDSELMRRAFAVLRQEDPGPLELVHAGVDNEWKYDGTYRVYGNNGKDYIIVSAFDSVDHGTAMIYTMALFGEFLAARGILTSDIVPSSIVFTTATSNGSGDEYSLIRQRLIEAYVRTGCLRIEQECPNAGEWYSIILGPGAHDVVQAVHKLEGKHDT